MDDYSRIDEDIAELAASVSKAHDAISKGKMSADALATMQQELLTIINTTGYSIKSRLEESSREMPQIVSSPNQSQQVETQGVELAVLTKRLEEVLGYTRRVEEMVEIAQRQGIVACGSAAQPEPSARAVHEIMRERRRYIPMGFKSLFDKYVGRSGLAWTAEDFRDIVRMREQIGGLLKTYKGDVDLCRDLKEIARIINEIQSAIQTAFTKKMEVLEKLDIEKLKTLLDNPNRNDQEEQELMFIFHDLYWDFNSPLDSPLSFHAFNEIATMFGKEELISKMKLFKSMEDALNKYDIEKDKISVYKDSSTLLTHKMEYLQKKRQENSSSDSPQVLILGGGPGGMMHALVAGVKGADVKIMEKRNDFARENKITITNTPLLQYFGIFDRLRQANTADLSGWRGTCAIKDIEQALLDTVHDCLGEEVIQHHSEFRGIQLAEKKEGGTEAACLISHGAQADWYAADYIIDATGARAAVAEVTGNKSKEISKPTVGVAYVTPTGYHWVSSLSKEDIQNLLRLQEQQASLKQQLTHLGLSAERKTELQQELQAVGAKIKEVASEAIPSDSTLQSAFRIQVTAREAALMMGDSWIMQSGDALSTPDPKTGLGCEKAFGGSQLFSHVLDLGGSPESFQHFVYGAMEQTDTIVKISAVESPKLHDTVEGTLHSCIQKGLLTEKDAANFRLLLEKSRHDIPYTEQNKEAILQLQSKISSIDKHTSTASFQEAWEEIISKS